MKFLGHRLDAIWPYRGWTTVGFLPLTVPEAFCTSIYVIKFDLRLMKFLGHRLNAIWPYKAEKLLSFQL